LIIVPRHPERFDTVSKLCEDTGLATIRRSSGKPVLPETAILLGDSMGELLLWYAVADVAFIGGSLIPHGGHNPLEAAAFGIPIVSGIHTANFTDIFPPLCAANGAVQISDEAALQAQLLTWLQDPTARAQAGVNAAAFFAQQQGVLALILQHIRPHIRQSP
jgi:3-deoxy-D-manno-octulosonic-acid transferase